MLNPHQAARLKAMPFSDSRTIFEGHPITTRVIALREPPAGDHTAAVSECSFYPPERIFGTPLIPECLDGIGSWPIHISEPGFTTHPGARVIGFCSLVTEEGRLLTPHELFRSTKDVFISWNSYNHHGYAFDEIDGDFVVRHVGREVPCYRDYNALFFHNIEPGNYGSFVLRQLPQMILARTKSLECDCYIVAERLPWVADALRLLGFPDKPMFSVPEISGDQFRSITLCGDCDAEGFTSPETRRKFKDILRESQSLVLPADGPKRIYVSRSLSALARPDYRVMRNQQEIERWLSSRGFTIIYPEILSFAAQMRIFYNAQYIVGPSGSGMFNILFAESPRKVLDIETFHVTVRQHAKFYASCGAKYSFLFCRPETDANPDLIACPYTLPVPLLDEALHWLLEDEDFGE